MMKCLLALLLCVSLVACDEDDGSGFVFGTDSQHIKNKTNEVTQPVKEWWDNPDKNCAPGYKSVPNKAGIGSACAPK